MITLTKCRVEPWILDIGEIKKKRYTEVIESYWYIRRFVFNFIYIISRILQTWAHFQWLWILSICFPEKNQCLGNSWSTGGHFMHYNKLFILLFIAMQLTLPSQPMYFFNPPTWSRCSRPWKPLQPSSRLAYTTWTILASLISIW